MKILEKNYSAALARMNNFNSLAKNIDTKQRKKQQ
jgi:hypothetical protein